MVDIYYAHPTFMYGTEYEKKDLELLMKHFPEAKVTNPAKLKFRHKKCMPIYEYFASLHDIVAYRVIAGRFVTAGVCEEVMAGVWKGANIVRISKRGDKLVIEGVDRIRDYPLTPKESSLLGKALRFASEEYLIREISELRTRHRLTPKSALLLVCTKVLSKTMGMDWVDLLQGFVGASKNIPMHWLKVIKREKARERIIELISVINDTIGKLILQTCLKFFEDLELRKELMGGKYAKLPERVLAFFYAAKLREEKLSYKRIAKEIHEAFDLKVSPGEVCNWIRGRYNPLRRCGQIRDCPELGYILGAWLGDGYLALDKKYLKYYVVLNSKSIDFVREWGKCLAKVTGNSNAYRPKWDKFNKRWFVRASNVLLWMILTIAREDPYFIYSILERYPEYACRGWFDAEGSVSLGERKIVGVNTDLRQITLFQDLLNKCGIKSKYYSRFDEGKEFISPYSGKVSRRKRTNYILAIYAKEDRLKFAKRASFTVPYKLENLRKQLKRYGYY